MNELTKQSLDTRHSEVIESHYLHTIYGNYNYVKNNFLEKINLQLSKSIWNNVIRNQQAREDRFLKKLGINGSTSKDKMVQLNKWIQNNELLQQTLVVQNDYIDNVLQESLDRSLVFYGNEGVGEKDTEDMVNSVVKALSRAKQESINEVVRDYNESIGNSFSEFENNIASVIQKNLKQKNKSIEELKNSITQSAEIQNLKGAILKNGLQDAVDELVKGLLKDKNISSKDKVAARRMKQSYDSRIEVNADLTNKFLNLKRSDIHIPLRWGGKTDTIDNFINKMATYPRLADGVSGFNENRDSIIYTIVNTLLFTRFNVERSRELQQILKMVRQSILYMAMEQTNEENDSDFLFIGNKLVPFSLLMERIRDYDSFKPTITVNGTGLVPYDKKVLKQKQQSPIENGEYYTGALEIGATNGNLIWKSIRLKNLDLQLNLKI